jgi:hypothetical protein
MKYIDSKLIFFCLSILVITACEKDEQAQVELDIRDTYVGSYICEVTKKNFQTQVILDRYIDTIQVAKEGEEQLKIIPRQNIQFPDVKLLQVNGPRQLYVGMVTIVVLNQAEITIDHGPDSAFYELRGLKMR